MSINCKIQLKGNIGSKPKAFKQNDDKEYVVLSVATADTYQDANGKWQKRQTVWHEVIFFTTNGVASAKQFHKGNHVIIEGLFTYKPVETKDGIKIKQALIVGTYIAKALFKSKSIME